MLIFFQLFGLSRSHPDEHEAVQADGVRRDAKVLRLSRSSRKADAKIRKTRTHHSARAGKKFGTSFYPFFGNLSANSF